MHGRSLTLTMVVLELACILLPGPLSADPADGAEGEEFVVAAVQTELRLWRSRDEFAEHMSHRVVAAMKHAPDLIVFPEDIGLPLVGLGDADLLARARILEEAVGALLQRHADEIGALMAEHDVSPPRALWLAKHGLIQQVYRETFAALARKHGVHIAAGSVPMVLPDRPTEVHNTACLFDPRGRMHIVGTKVNLVPLEGAGGLDLSPGSIEDYRVFRMPGAVVGTIVCADGWQPEIARRLVDQGANVLVQVSANPEVWTEGTRDGWRDSLFTRVQELQVYGVCAMGVGNLLNLPIQGQSAIVAPRDWTADGSGILAEAISATDEEIIVAPLDLGRVARNADGN